MKPDPLTTSPVPHEEVTRRFLQGLNGQSPAKSYPPVTDRLITFEAAAELERWFKK